MQRLLWLIVILVVSITACQVNTQGSSSNSSEIDAAKPYKLDLDKAPANLGELKMNLNQLGPFHSRFTLEFEGQTDWVYQVDTRSDGANIEFQLVVNGVEGNLDLGDVQLVNTSGQNYMSGPATDEQCFQFPDTFETEPLFLGPTEFIHLAEFSTLPEETGTESILGRDAVHYTASPGSHLGWQDVSVSFWLDTQTQAVLKYEFSATGNDPLYLKGDGKIHGFFEVLEIGPQEIREIPNCVIDFPLPGEVEGLIRFPGMLAFTTTLRPAKLNKFYAQALEPEGWTQEKPQTNPQTQDKVFEYSSQNSSIIMHVVPLNLKDFSEGYQVEIYFDE
ncbi:MAG: hypothetical protein P8Y68_06290 [Anaerolineales bacterium]|jgi:hypothetical protein